MDEKKLEKCCEACVCEECEVRDGSCCEECSCDENQTSSGGADGHLKELEERVKSLEDQLKRAVADYRNLEKRVAEGRSEFSSWAAQELVRKMLPVLDYLEKAIVGMGGEDKKSGWAQGVVMSVKQFKEVLKSEGLEEIKGDGEFDPNLHEAVDMKDGEDNKVLEVTEIGYKINDKVLRPAKVVVGKSESRLKRGG